MSGVMVVLFRTIWEQGSFTYLKGGPDGGRGEGGRALNGGCPDGRHNVKKIRRKRLSVKRLR